ncbi:MAG: UMP kinase [Termitinemataceae bacterium]|nr:MAG: UMP kinase [Termitinemataceae bacterium]
MEKVIIISLGGSIVAPDKPDEKFLGDFINLIKDLLLHDVALKFIFVVGGGGPARSWQNSFKNISPVVGLQNNDSPKMAASADWIGIMATRLNAQLVKELFGKLCTDAVITDPSCSQNYFTSRILVASGWKPGFSTDNDAVLLAKRFGASSIINLSNIEKVYTDDPKKNPAAKPLDKISWDEFKTITGDKWVPGKNVPFDPVASRAAEEAGLTVICAAGSDLENLKNIIDGKEYNGTTIS